MEVRSTLAMNTLLSSRLSSAQAQIQKLQGQVASGQRADTYAELGTQAGIDIALRNEASAIATFQVNNQILASRMSAMDQAMMAIHSAAEEVKTEAYALSPSDTSRTALIDRATVAFNSVVNALQVSVGGRALFAGDQTDVTPMVSSIFTDLQASIAALAPPVDAAAVETAVSDFFATPTNVYRGGDALRPSPIDQNISVDYGILASDPAFTDVLQGLATIALAPKPDVTDDTAEADYATVIGNAAAALSRGIGQLSQLISSNGTNQALVETTNVQHEETLTMIRQQINTIEQTDMTQAASLLAQLRTQIEASYAMTAQINQLSLVNYLR